VLVLGDDDILGLLPGNGVRAGPPWLELVGASSENIRPIEDSGRWIVRNNPVIAAFSSITSPLSSSFDAIDSRGTEASPSIEGHGVTSVRLIVDFSDNCVGGDPPATSTWCFSAMVDTAASTFFSNSSSEMVKLVRSRFSIN
jgi:hypothetical protein